MAYTTSCLFVGFCGAFGAMLVQASSLATSVSPHAKAFASATVVVDFSTRRSIKSQSGLLHGLNFQSKPFPDDSQIAAIRPRIWRATAGVVPIARAKSVGAKYVLILSDHWGYPVDGWPNGKPWMNIAQYEGVIRSLAQTYNGLVDIWDIWNEPDPAYGTTFWDGTEQQFFDTYLRAYKILRQELGPNAVIAGPSITHYDAQYLDRFASFCIANGCQANVLTYHENSGTRPIQNIGTKLLDARARYINAPANAPLAVREIHIQEFSGPTQVYSPSTSLLYMQYLELGQSDAAARSCWNDSKGDSECFNNSLDGLITPGTFLPRSVWWASVLYAQGTDGRVAAAASQPQVVALASLTPSSEGFPTGAVAQLLTGVSNVDDAPAEADLDLRIGGVTSIPELRGASHVRVHIYVVAPSGNMASNSPMLTRMEDLEIIDGEIRIRISAAASDALYQVALFPRNEPSSFTVVEYYNSVLDHYFITPVKKEIALLDARVPPFQNWTRTGFAFNSIDPLTASLGSAPICRFFNDKFAPKSSHFYAPRGLGCEDTITKFKDWILEDDNLFSAQIPSATGTCPIGTNPLFRLYNNGMGGAPAHRFVVSLAERQRMLNLGYVAEGTGAGVGMCVRLTTP